MMPHLRLCDLWSLVACGNPTIAFRLRNGALIECLELNSSTKAKFDSLVKHGRLDKISRLWISSVDVSTARDALATPQLLARIPFLRSFKVEHISLVTELFHQEAPWTKGAFNTGRLDLSAVMPSLEDLSLSMNPSEAYLWKSILSLPSMLRSIEIAGFNVLPYISSFPPHLTKLHLPHSSILSPSVVQRLPKTITSLEGCFADDYENRGGFGDYGQPIELRVADYLSRRQLRLILDEVDPDWSSHVPTPTPDIGDLDELKQVHLQRFNGWGCGRYLPRLTHFGVYHHGDDNPPVCDVLLLPSTLKSLVTDLGASYHAFSFMISPASWPPHMTSLVTKNVSFARHAMPEGLTDISMRFCHLGSSASPPPPSPPIAGDSQEDLVSVPFIPETTALNTAERLGAASFDRLAPELFLEGLHTLKVSLFRNKISFSDISRLPRSLTHLEVSDLEFDATEFKQLLQSFSCPPRFPSSQIAEYFSKTNLFEGFLAERAKENASSSNLPPFWPPGLVTFITQPKAGSSLSSSFLACLPPSLTEYNVGTINFNYDVVALISAVASHKLRKVSRESIIKDILDLWEVTERRFFEPSFEFSAASLSTLYPLTEELNLEGMISVERLVNLNIDGVSACPVEHLVGFQKLRALTIGHKTTLVGSEQLFEFLPPTVTSVDFTGAKAYISDHLLVTMPPNIEKLAVGVMARTLACVPFTFSSGLQGSELSESTLESSIDDLVRSLGDRVQIATLVTDLSLTPYSSLPRLPSVITNIDLPNDSGKEQFYSILPESLTHLRLVKPTQLSDKVVPLFPTSLKHLEVVEDLALTNACISCLPNLETLKLPANSRLTSGAIASLPRSLTVLHLNSALITDTHVELLPALITDLNLSWSEISERSLPLLPRGLISLDVESAERLSNADPSPLPPTITRLIAPDGMLDRANTDNFPLLVKEASTSAPSFEGGLFDF